MTVGDWISAIAAAVQTAALVVGAAWAYFKFVRGRTFARRTELSVSGELLRHGRANAIRARVALRNTGSSDIPLRVAAVYVYAVGRTEWRGDRSPAWKKVAVEPVLTRHKSIEAQESISEDVLVPLPEDAGAETLAYRVELQVYDQRKQEGAIRWSSQSVVPGAMRPVVASDTL